jgi:2,3-dihydroxybenzoate-AMP ligase
MKENIAQMAARGAKLWPSKVAIEACGRTLTYQELDEQSDVLAQGLARLGHAFGDRLVISLNNCIEYILVSFLCTVHVWSWLVLT